MFWDNFLAICKARGVKPTPVLNSIGLSSSNTANWQAGSSPKGDSLLELSKYFGCSIDYLMTGSEHKSFSDTMSNKEIELIEMYRKLPNNTQEFVYDSIETACLKSIGLIAVDKLEK